MNNDKSMFRNKVGESVPGFQAAFTEVETLCLLGFGTSRRVCECYNQLYNQIHTILSHNSTFLILIVLMTSFTKPSALSTDQNLAGLRISRVIIMARHLGKNLRVETS
jgi:hypothetical protein